MAKPRETPPQARTDRKVHRSICPACRKWVETSDVAADENFPFCSRRCKLVDLGKWFESEHRISTPVEIEDE